MTTIFNDPLFYIGVALLNIFMLQSYVPIQDVYFSYNAPSWSISNELFFYILFPFLIYFFVKKFKGSFSKRFIISILLVYIGATLLVWFMRDSNLAHWLFYISPMFRVLDFLIGIVLGLWFINKQASKQVSTRFMTFMEMLALCFLVLTFLFFPYIHQTLRFWGYYQPVMVFIIAVFAFQRGYISQIMSTKILIYLGEISFSFYMIHQLVIRYATRIPFINNQPILFLLLSLAMSLIGSHFIFKYYEIPMKDKIKNLNIFSK